MADPQQTISIPSLIFVAAIGVAIVRYFFFSPASSPSRSQNSRPANPNDVEQIAAMFPQVPRRDIMWDLQRNGGNMASTTERILTLGRLEVAPPTFQPAIPTPLSASFLSNPKSDYMDLIKKYNLTNKLANPPAAKGQGASTSQQTWSSDRKERQEILKRRREEMVLKARRKMEEKERQGSGG